MRGALGVRARLGRAARDSLREYGISVSAPGRIFLSLLLTKAAIKLVREGRAGNDYYLSEAEDNLRALLVEASGAAPAQAQALYPQI